jgi:hypothetical protein
MELNIQNTFKLFTLLFHRQLFSSNSHWSAFVISLNQSITRHISFHKKLKIRLYPEITSLLSPGFGERSAWRLPTPSDAVQFYTQTKRDGENIL